MLTVKRLFITIASLILLISCSSIIVKRDVGLLYKGNEPYSGEHKEYYSNGNIRSVGYYEDGLMTGEWTYYYESGITKATGHFVDGYGGDISEISGIPRNGREGHWVFNHESGKRDSESDFKGGKLHGRSLEWYENGKLKGEFNYKYGELNGKQMGWYDNGNKQREGTFNDGLLDGKQIEWYENGAKKSELNYKDNKRDGKLLAWYENGKKKQEATFKNGFLDGKFTEWYENGNTKQEAIFDNGIAVGKWIYYKSDGSIKQVRDHAEGPGQTTPEEETTFTFIPYDKPPEPIGGYSAISKNIIYPELTQEANIEGTVIVQAFVNENGFVTQAIIQQSIHPDLDKSAINAIKQCRFRPAEQKGRKVGVWISIPVNFALKED